jgi:micrococcal nuclease
MANKRKISDFRKPFEAVPIRLGRTYRRRAAKKKLAGALQQAALLGGIAVSVFGLGMLVTNWGALGAQSVMSSKAASGQSACAFLTVHDGDTIRCGTERVRLADIDAPELSGSPRCEGYRAATSWCDYELARRSRSALKAFLDTGRVEVIRQGEDNYGRTLAIVRVEGVSAGEHLIRQGLARPW